MQIIDGKKISKEILADIKKEVGKLNFQPIFCDVLVGEDSASIQYVKMKMKIAESLGILFHKAFFPSSITTEELIKEIEILNEIKNMSGIIIQLPLPAHIDRQKVLDSINPNLDVDCLGFERSQKFYNQESDFSFPTALACIKLLDSINVDLRSKNIVVLGQGLLVGKPVTSLLKFRNLSPIIIDNEIENKEELIRKADIIISGIGKGKFIKGNMIKKGVILIDAGTSEDNGSIVGDVDLESVKNVALLVSPVPGGVGPVTIAMLFQNLLTVAKKLKNNN